MREAALLLGLLPWLWFGGSDLLFHFRARKPGLLETFVHIGIGFFQVGFVAAAFLGSMGWVCLWFTLLSLFGAIDEYIFHHDLPVREVDLHAKAHFALLIFASVAVLLTEFP